MGDNIWNFRKRLKLLAGTSLIALVVFLFFKYVFPLAWPLILAASLAFLLDGPILFFSKKFCRGKKVIAATIIMTIVCALIFGSIALLLYIMLGEITSIISGLERELHSLSKCIDGMCRQTDRIIKLDKGTSIDFLCKCRDNLLDRDSSRLATDAFKHYARPITSKIFFFVAGVIVCLIGAVYASARLEKYRDWRRENIFSGEIMAVHQSLKCLINVYFRVQLIILGINSLACVIVFMIMGNDFAVVLGIAIGVIDALPIFGTGTVLLPWIVIDLVMGKISNAVILLVLYLVTYFVREILESKCLGDRVGIAPFTMLSVIYLGILVYGVMGFILGPISYCIAKALVLHLKSNIENDKL